MPAWKPIHHRRFEALLGLVASALEQRPAPASAFVETSAPAASVSATPLPVAPIPPPVVPRVDYALKAETFFPQANWSGVPAAPAPAEAVAPEEVSAEAFFEKAQWGSAEESPAPPVVATTPALITGVTVTTTTPVTIKISAPPDRVTPELRARLSSAPVPAHRNPLVAGLFSAAATSRRLLSAIAPRSDQAKRFFTEANWEDTSKN